LKYRIDARLKEEAFFTTIPTGSWNLKITLRYIVYIQYNTKNYFSN